MNRRTPLAIQVTGVCTTCAACFTRSACCLSTCPRHHRLVCKAFCTLRVLSLRMSLVTAYKSRACCTAAEPHGVDEGVWDADKDSASDLNMYMQFSEGKGEGWPDPDEARGRRLSQPLFFRVHTHTTPSPLQHAFTQQTPQRWRGGHD